MCVVYGRLYMTNPMDDKVDDVVILEFRPSEDSPGDAKFYGERIEKLFAVVNLSLNVEISQ